MNTDGYHAMELLIYGLENMDRGGESNLYLYLYLYMHRSI